jgi:hypothetical protein
MNLTGFRTFLVGLATVVVPATLTYAAGFDWTQIVSPTVALMVSGGLQLALRAVTSTPLFAKK